ncbi:unnamed protein product [marine sediment metagenome]|uniref:CN hydrolase domain-containing protein n=1 Tax=marine sediment metagenome TaxID=412755 RepID=X0WNZ9_9ZZZZ
MVGPDGQPVASYDKLQPFTFGGEADHYTAGCETVLFDWQGLRVAPLICYDLRFPELFRAATRRGAQAFVVIANWPTPRVAHWNTLLAARAIENQAYVVGVNRTGSEPKLDYPGESQILDPQGNQLACAGPGEGILRADIALDPLLQYRANFPALPDMRPDFFPDPT